jgi:hypothetical protein
MLNKYEIVTLIILAGITVGIGSRIAVNHQNAKIAEEKKQQEIAQQVEANRQKIAQETEADRQLKQIAEADRQQKEIARMMAEVAEANKFTMQAPNPTYSYNANHCQNNTFAPGCRENIVPIDPTPAEKAMRRSGLPR